jgi:hypothetical protein
MNPEPVEPASWMTMIGSSDPARARNLCLFFANKAKSSPTSRLRKRCLEIFSPDPGESAVTSQDDRDSSRDTKIAPSSMRTTVCSDREIASCIIAYS